jgi:hypothetical protein
MPKFCWVQRICDTRDFFIFNKSKINEPNFASSNINIKIFVHLKKMSVQDEDDIKNESENNVEVEDLDPIVIRSFNELDDENHRDSNEKKNDNLLTGSHVENRCEKRFEVFASKLNLPDLFK